MCLSQTYFKDQISCAWGGDFTTVSADDLRDLRLEREEDNGFTRRGESPLRVTQRDETGRFARVIIRGKSVHRFDWIAPPSGPEMWFLENDKFNDQHTGVYLCASFRGLSDLLPSVSAISPNHNVVLGKCVWGVEGGMVSSHVLS